MNDVSPEKRPHRILIVDDIPKNIQLAANILIGEGYQMAYANSGKDALTLNEKNEYDLILLDIMMPEMDGLEVCRRLRNSPKTKDLPVIFLTAKNDTESILKGFEVGAMDYVTKPFNGMELLARVRTHLALSRARNTLAEMNQVLKKSEEKFRYLANHDNLTQLYNTRYLYAHLPELIESARTEEGVFSLIFFDIDHFKQVVDTYGHLNGSRTIAEVAGTIRRCIQPPAYGVAYAGDEFIVVLPGFSKAAAVEKAEEIRTRMAETTYLESLGHAVRISASFGISTYPEDGEEMRDLLAKADRAMFDIKESGKNAVGF